MRRKLQFGLSSVVALIGIAAVAFAVYSPPRFPSDDSIRRDLEIDERTEIHVFDRDFEELDRGTRFIATVHIAKPQDHRLIRVWCMPDSNWENDHVWQPYEVRFHSNDGECITYISEQRLKSPPTEAQRREVRESGSLMNSFGL